MDQHFLSQIPWRYAIIDEAQRLKNPSSVSLNACIFPCKMPSELDFYPSSVNMFDNKSILVVGGTTLAEIRLYWWKCFVN